MTAENPAQNREKELVEQLDSFDEETRRQALEKLKELADQGRVPLEDQRPWVNMHCHTFYSFNARGYSPSRFAWEAWQRGLEAGGTVDFDCLDAVEEFLDAGMMLGLKVAAGFETRAFIPEYRDKEINSPNEPGVYYLAGTGFTRPPEEGTDAAETFDEMLRMSRRRNEGMMERINKHLQDVTIDYDEDVLPLTPAGNATERHMLVAYEEKARQTFPDTEDLVDFWTEKLDADREMVEAVIDDVPELKRIIRKKLMKAGGVGFVPPDQGSFPDIDRVVDATLECEALPSACWLDGTSAAEADPMRHFQFLKGKGIPTMTIIPDRNWDIEDPEEKQLKLEKLDEVVEVARKLNMPILVGTEMNKRGQKFVDSFDAPELKPYHDDFLAGARVAWGHTLLKMTGDLSYTGRWSREQFGDDEAARNEFYRRVGAAPMPSSQAMERLCGLDKTASTEDILGIVEA